MKKFSEVSQLYSSKFIVGLPLWFVQLFYFMQSFRKFVFIE